MDTDPTVGRWSPPRERNRPAPRRGPTSGQRPPDHLERGRSESPWAGRHTDPGSRRDELGRAGVDRHHHRGAARHRFECNNTERLTLVGGERDVCVRQRLGDERSIVHMAEEADRETRRLGPPVAITLTEDGQRSSRSAGDQRSECGDGRRCPRPVS